MVQNAKTLRRQVVLLCIGLATLVVASGLPHAQSQTQSPQVKHLNPMIARLEEGEPALMGDVWQYIEMEHGAYSIDRLQTILADLGKRKKPNGQLELAPIIRIPSEGGEDSVGWQIKQVLDSGVMGVIVPHVETAEQALEAVRWMRYPPQRSDAKTVPREPVGKRGSGPRGAVRVWGISQNEYFKRADLWPLNPDGDLTLTVMVETALGVQNADAIASVPGVSIINVGTGDLASSMGLRGQPVGKSGLHAEEEAAVQKVLAACKAHNVVCSMNGAPESYRKTRLAEGWRVTFGPNGKLL